MDSLFPFLRYRNPGFANRTTALQRTTRPTQGSSSIRFIRSKRQDVDIYDKMTIKQADRYDMIYLDIIIVYPIYRYLDRSKDPGDLEELPGSTPTSALHGAERIT